MAGWRRLSRASPLPFAGGRRGAGETRGADRQPTGRRQALRRRDGDPVRLQPIRRQYVVVRLPRGDDHANRQPRRHRDLTDARNQGDLARFFRCAATRYRLNASPLPSVERRRSAPSFTADIDSEAEPKHSLAAVSAATGGPRSRINANTLRAFVLLRPAPDCIAASSGRGLGEQGAEEPAVV